MVNINKEYKCLTVFELGIWSRWGRTKKKSGDLFLLVNLFSFNPPNPAATRTLIHPSHTDIVDSYWDVESIAHSRTFRELKPRKSVPIYSRRLLPPPIPPLLFNY
jgi:hypothetical protein